MTSLPKLAIFLAHAEFGLDGTSLWSYCDLTPGKPRSTVHYGIAHAGTIQISSGPRNHKKSFVANTPTGAKIPVPLCVHEDIDRWRTALNRRKATCFFTKGP